MTTGTVPTLDGALTPLLRRVVGRPGVVTVPEAIDDVVVVVPHPDDETLSTGLLLAHLAAVGVPTRILAVTDGEAAYPDCDPTELARVRTVEQENAVRMLGHRGVIRRLRIADGRVADDERLLATVIARHVDERSLLVAPSPYDWHPDHEACGRAAAAVAATVGCPRWSSMFWAHAHPARLLATGPELLPFVGDRKAVARRQCALECHDSQLRRADGEPILAADDLAHLAHPVEVFAVETEAGRP